MDDSELGPACNNCSDDFSETLSMLYNRYPVNDWKKYGFFEDSFVRHMQPHWFSFGPTPPNVHSILAVIYGIIMLTGMVGNLLVITLFVRCRTLRTPANYLIVNLALSDFLLLCETPIFIFNSFHRGPAIGYAGCQLYGFIGGLTGTGSIMTLAMIAIDRYYAIVHPMNPLKKTTRSRAVLIIAFVWLYSLIFASIPIFSSLQYVPEGLLTSCSFDYLSPALGNRIFIFTYFLAAWVFPLVLIVFSYMAIFRMVVKAEKFADFEQDGNSRKTYKSRQREKLRKELRIAVITTVIIIVWLVAWTPYAMVSLMGIFGQRQLLTPIVSAIPACFCKTASCIDPFIYSLSHPRFQREIMKLNIMASCVAGAWRRQRVTRDTLSSQYCSVTYARSEEESFKTDSDMHLVNLQYLMKATSNGGQQDSGSVVIQSDTTRNSSVVQHSRSDVGKWEDFVDQEEIFKAENEEESYEQRQEEDQEHQRCLSLPVNLFHGTNDKESQRKGCPQRTLSCYVSKATAHHCTHLAPDKNNEDCVARNLETVDPIETRVESCISRKRKLEPALQTQV